METVKPPIWARLWFSWVALTVIYLLLFFAPDPRPTETHITTFFGLFVPIGFLSLSGILMSERTFALSTIPIFFVVLIVTNEVVQRWQISNGMQLIVNVMALFCLTLLVDLLLYGSWVSFEILLKGDFF